MVDADLVASAHSVPIEQEIDRRGIRLRGRVERMGPCPRCGGIDRFSINTKKQCWNCRGCAKGGDVVALVMHIDSVSFGEAIASLAGEAPVRDPKPAMTAHARKHEDPDAGTPGEDYLRGRGIDVAQIPDDADLKWHPECLWQRGTHPCLVARFSDAISGAPMGIQRIATADGKKIGKLSLGTAAGCVVLLWPDDCVTQGLVLGEGIETVLSAATRIQHRNTLLQPAWATGGTGNMASFPVLAGIEAITILVDNDSNNAGQNAAETCAQRWLAAGREVVRLTPKNNG
jgi:phage/plasmid primase-like uncharacterized protein